MRVRLGVAHAAGIDPNPLGVRRARRPSAARGWSRPDVDQKPSTNLASSDIISGDHGGVQVRSVTTSPTPSRLRTTSPICSLDQGSGRAAHRGQRVGDGDCPAPTATSYTRPRSTDIHAELGILDRPQRLEHVLFGNAHAVIVAFGLPQRGELRARARPGRRRPPAGAWSPPAPRDRRG